MATYLTDVASFRIRSPMPSTVTDSMIGDLFDGLEQRIESYLGFAPQQQTYTKYYSGNLSNPAKILLLPYTVAVSTVYENATGYFQSANFTSTQLLTAGTDYALANEGVNTPGILLRINRYWPMLWGRAPNRLSLDLTGALGSVKATFTAGLNQVQMAQVIEAGYLEAAAWKQSWRTGYGLQTSSGMDGYNIAITPFLFNRPGLPNFISAAAEMILRSLRRIPVA